MNYYYSNTNKQPTGPVSFADLQKLAETGAITAGTPVIAEGASQWTTWGEVQKSASGAAPVQPTPAPASADPSALMAERVVSSMRSMPIGDALFGILLILVSFFTTPYTVLVRACTNLAEWGQARRLPTSESEIPVLTYFTIVGRPLAHVLWLCGFFIAGIVMLFTGGIFQNRYYGYSFGSALGMMLLCWLVAYFGQLVVGLLCESGSVLIRMANDVNKIAKR
jgi:hypothetical protein